ncbi:Rrf2 family transcriptional regulator [Limosilactobacillus sp.]|jgi:DNA-binding IscR family transcriptional regulator|uniref:Rrf2 family transcriptional regulator n=1 Tax=Limosilactobacillus sp. TaxID=2773925 RepID=UPI00359FF892
MKYSYKFSDAIHILSYLYIFRTGDLSSKAIANSIGSNPSVVRKLMSDLREAGLIETQQGAAKPVLAKTPQKINLLDIFQALKMDHHFLHVDPKTNPQSVVGSNIQDTLSHLYGEIEQAAFERMSKITLQEVLNELLRRQRSNNN